MVVTSVVQLPTDGCWFVGAGWSSYRMQSSMRHTKQATLMALRAGASGNATK